MVKANLKDSKTMNATKFAIFGILAALLAVIFALPSLALAAAASVPVKITFPESTDISTISCTITATPQNIAEAQPVTGTWTSANENDGVKLDLDKDGTWNITAEATGYTFGEPVAVTVSNTASTATWTVAGQEGQDTAVTLQATADSEPAADQYSITVDDAIENGEILITSINGTAVEEANQSSAEAAEGDTVVMTVVAATGYEIDGLPTVTATNEEIITVTAETEENQYSFEMPASDVILSANFLETGSDVPELVVITTELNLSLSAAAGEDIDTGIIELTYTGDIADLTATPDPEGFVEVSNFEAVEGEEYAYNLTVTPLAVTPEEPGKVTIASSVEGVEPVDVPVTVEDSLVPVDIIFKIKDVTDYSGLTASLYDGQYQTREEAEASGKIIENPDGEEGKFQVPADGNLSMQLAPGTYYTLVVDYPDEPAFEGLADIYAFEVANNPEGVKITFPPDDGNNPPEGTVAVEVQFQIASVTDYSGITATIGTLNTTTNEVEPYNGDASYQNINVPADGLLKTYLAPGQTYTLHATYPDGAAFNMLPQDTPLTVTDTVTTFVAPVTSVTMIAKNANGDALQNVAFGIWMGTTTDGKAAMDYDTTTNQPMVITDEQGFVQVTGMPATTSDGAAQPYTIGVIQTPQGLATPAAQTQEMNAENRNLVFEFTFEPEAVEPPANTNQPAANQPTNTPTTVPTTPTNVPDTSQQNVSTPSSSSNGTLAQTADVLGIGAFLVALMAGAAAAGLVLRRKNIK